MRNKLLKKIKKAEKSLALMALLGVLFKLMHYKGGDILLILSLGTLIMLYFIFGFIVLDQNR